MTQPDAYYLEAAETLAERYAAQLDIPDSILNEALRREDMADKPQFRTITMSVPADTRVLELHAAVAAYFTKSGHKVHVPSPLGWFVRPKAKEAGDKPVTAAEMAAIDWTQRERLNEHAETLRRAIFNGIAPLSATDEADTTDAGVREVVA